LAKCSISIKVNLVMLCGLGTLKHEGPDKDIKHLNEGNCNTLDCVDWIVGFCGLYGNGLCVALAWIVKLCGLCWIGFCVRCALVL
jgi:hypothetical protein